MQANAPNEADPDQATAPARIGTPGTPFEPQAAGCGAYTTTATGSGQCVTEPTHAGVIYYRRPEQLRWAFACKKHKDLLQAPRPLNDRDRAELIRRRDKVRAILEQHVPEIPDEPLATGPAARARLRRALRAAQRHQIDPARPHGSQTGDTHDPGADSDAPEGHDQTSAHRHRPTGSPVNQERDRPRGTVD